MTERTYENLIKWCVVAGRMPPVPGDAEGIAKLWAEFEAQDSLRHDPALFNEVNALISVEGEPFVRFSHRREITNRFLDWHYAQIGARRSGES